MVGPAVILRALQKKGFQATMLFGRQAWRRTGLGFGCQAVRGFSQLEPTVDGTTVDAKNARHQLGAFSLMDSFYCVTSPPFQLRGGSKWYVHIYLDIRQGKNTHSTRS